MRNVRGCGPRRGVTEQTEQNGGALEGRRFGRRLRSGADALLRNGSHRKSKVRWTAMGFCARAGLVIIFWGMPVAAFACNGVRTRAYADVTQIYVSTHGLTVPVAIDAHTSLSAGDCPDDRNVRIWREGTAMAGSQCVHLSSGRLSGKTCCPTVFATDDPPARIFARLLAVLERDRFYDVAAKRNANSTQSGAVFEIAVVRCA